MIFLVAPMILAYEWDNKKTYVAEEDKYIIKNSFLGIFPLGTVAEITLKTSHYYNVIAGKDRLVGSFEINAFENYTESVFDLMEFYDLKDNMNKFERPFVYKHKVKTGEKDQPVYVESCKIGANLSESCSLIQNGTKKVDVYEWKEFKESQLVDFPKGSTTVGIFTDVYPGETKEWIITLMGVRLPEWAVWNESKSYGLTHYWEFQELNNGNFTDFGAAYNYNMSMIGNPSLKSGANGSGLYCDGSDDRGDATGMDGIPDGTNLYTVNFWMNESVNVSYGGIVGTTSNEAGFEVFSLSDKITWYTGGGGSNYFSTPQIINNNKWYMVTLIRNGSGSNDCHIYINGTYAANGAGKCGDAAGINLRICYNGANGMYNGVLDELMIWNRSLSSNEIEDLYNDGDGIFYTAGTLPDNSPSVTLIAPINNSNVSTAQTFNCTAEDDYLIDNVSLWIDGALNYTETDGSDNYTELLYSLNLDEGSHDWTCQAYDNASHGVWGINNTLTFDLSYPSVLVDSISDILTLGTLVNITLNVSVSDLTLNNCWYYNSTDNVSITCNDNATIELPGGSYVLYYYANDSLGRISSNSTSFIINTYSFTEDHHTTIFEGDNSTFYFNLTSTNITTASTNMTFNNTVYQMDQLSNNGTYAVFSKGLTAPTVDADTNISFNYSFTINNGSDNSSYYYQMVYNITNLIIQTTPCTPAAYNFTLIDEANFSHLNGTIEYNFKYGSDNSTFIWDYGTFSDITSLYVCINDSISINWTLGEGQIFYKAPGFVERRYYLFDDSVLSNETNHINLYDLFTADQTSFKLEVEDTSLSPYQNKFTSLIRWYPGQNSYNVVEMGLTDEYGDTVIHARAEDVDYRIGVHERNGSLIKLEDPTRFVCLIDPCTYTLKISPSDQDLTSVFDIDYSFTFNSTLNLWSFVYSDRSQKTSSINLTVYKITGTSVYPVCSNTVSGYSGAVTCNTSTYTGTLKGVVVRAASPGVPFVEKIVSIGSTAFASTFGLWLSILIAIPIIFVFSIISPIAAIIGGIIALIPALYFGAINWAIMGGIAVLGGIVMHFLKRIG